MGFSAEQPPSSGKGDGEGQDSSFPAFPVTRLEPGKSPQLLSATDTPDKQALLSSLLDESKVQIRLDPRRPGVKVPEQFADDAVLALNLSWRFPNTHMVLNDRGVAATLRFGGVPFRCQLPWHAIWGIAPGDSDWLMVWTGDLPVEFGGPVEREDDERIIVEPGTPRLSLVSDAMSEADSNSPKEASPEDPSSPEVPSPSPEAADSSSSTPSPAASRPSEPLASELPSAGAATEQPVSSTSPTSEPSPSPGESSGVQRQTADEEDKPFSDKSTDSPALSSSAADGDAASAEEESPEQKSSTEPQEPGRGSAGKRGVVLRLVK